MAVVVCGLSYKTVPLHVLERTAIAPEQLPKALSRLVDHDAIDEAVVLSTCNRTEVYASVGRFHPARDDVRHFLSDVSGVALSDIATGTYTRHDVNAVRHLFDVSCGIDSMVVGEPQILGQVRDAFLVATEEGTARRLLSSVFQRALRVGKRVRTETDITRSATSLPEAAAQVASGLADGLAGRTVVVVGAGRMAGVTASAVRAAGATDLVIVNRTFPRASALADRLGAEAAGIETLPALLVRADVVISVTTQAHLIGREELAAAGPIVAIDLGMPRNIDPSVRDLAGVVLRDMEDLRAVVEVGAVERRALTDAVNAIVTKELDSFAGWQRTRRLGPAIEQLRGWAEAVRSEEVSRLSLTGADRDEVDRATRAIVNKLLHRPLTQMKELSERADGNTHIDAFQEVFDLDGE